MKHQLTQTFHMNVNCGKCKHKWKEPGRLVIYTCPLCKHEDTAVNTI